MSISETRDGVRWFQVNPKLTNNGLPPDKKLVMVTGDSGYVTHKKFLTFAYLDQQYRPWKEGEEPRWLNVQNDALTDCGWRPKHWAYPLKLP